MAYAVKVDNVTDIVTGTWTGGGSAIPMAPPSASYRYEEITESEHVDILTKGLTYPGGFPRWSHDGVTLTELPNSDARPQLSASPELTVQEEGLAGPPVSVTLTLSARPGDPPLSFTGPLTLTLSDGRPLLANFTNNIAVIDASRTKSYDVSIVTSDVVEVISGARVLVLAKDFEPG